MLALLGALDKVSEVAYRCDDIRVRHCDAVEYPLGLARLSGTPAHLLIVPRLVLDDLLRRHAIEAGAHFLPGRKVENLVRQGDHRVRVDMRGGESIVCRVPVLATGANTGLLRRAGLRKAPASPNLGARCYFEDVAGLDRSIVLFFDGQKAPGYGWVFPTGPRSANVGCGVFFDAPERPAAGLARMIDTHPYLRRILRNARRIGPVMGYPLRTDFRPGHGGGDWHLVVGESAGLVNPISGEGIDYALESGRLAVDAVLAGWKDGPTAAIGKTYRAALARKFQGAWWLSRLAQSLYFREGAVGNLLRRGQQRAYLRQAIVETCFGAADPKIILSPRTLWEVFSPLGRRRHSE
jgi:flavin-dependent dehydrogenase